MDADFQAAIDKDKEHRENLLQRIESWNYLTEAFIPFIQQMQKIEMTTGKAYTKLATTLQFKGNETSGLNEAVLSLKTFTTNIGTFHENYGNYLDEQTVAELKKLQRDVNDKGKKIKARLSNMNLAKIREPVLIAAANHKKACESVQAHKTSVLAHSLQPSSDGMASSSNGTSSNGSPPDESTFQRRNSLATLNLVPMSDPWATELRVKGLISQMIVEENKYKKAMLEVLEAIESTDALLLRTFKEVLSKCAKWKSRELKQIKVATDDVMHKMDKVNPEAEWTAFLQEKGMDKHLLWRQTVKVGDLDYSHKDTDKAVIVKQGMLLRQGRVISSHWKKAYFFLTECCFLHCYDSESAAFGSEKTLPADPLWSLDLRNCFVTVQCDESLMNNEFELKAGVGLGATEETGGAAALAKKGVRIKAASEEEMVDWVAAIKQKIAGFLKPPEVVMDNMPNNQNESTKGKEKEEGS